MMQYEEISPHTKMARYSKEVEEDKVMKAGIKYLRELGKVRREGSPVHHNRKTSLALKQTKN
jgi:hypothetical protein